MFFNICTSTCGDDAIFPKIFSNGWLNHQLDSYIYIYIDTPSKFNMEPENDGFQVRNLLFQWPIFRFHERTFLDLRYTDTPRFCQHPIHQLGIFFMDQGEGGPLVVINGITTCDPYKWPYKWVTGVITQTSGMITLLITSWGPPCRFIEIL